MYPTANRIHLPYFDPDYLTSGLTVTRLARVYCNHVLKMVIQQKFLGTFAGLHGVTTQSPLRKTLNSATPPVAHLQLQRVTWSLRVLEEALDENAE
jgi:uncharacterized membrane protein YeiB